MKKVLCVANFLFGSASGAQSLARTHVKALYQAFGKENVIVFALVGTEEVADQKDIQVKKVVNKLPIRLINLLKGNTGKINSEIISEIIETINRENVELFFLDDSIYGNAIRIIKKYCPKVKVASFYHDIKRYLAVEWAKKNPKSIPVQISLVSNERKTARYADVNIVLNKREEKLFQKYYHKSPEMLLPIILPTPKLSSRIDSDKCNILFVGGYYYPNVNGFRWFIKNVTPLIKINYEVTLVGNRMDLLKEEFSNNSNVKVLGRVEDLSPYYDTEKNYHDYQIFTFLACWITVIRLIYIAVASLIFALLMNVGLIDVKIGNVDISKAFTDIKPALVIGVLCGLVESKIGIQVYNKAVSLLVDNSEQ